MEFGEHRVDVYVGGKGLARHTENVVTFKQNVLVSNVSPLQAFTSGIPMFNVHIHIYSCQILHSIIRKMPFHSKGTSVSTLTTEDAAIDATFNFIATSTHSPYFISHLTGVGLYRRILPITPCQPFSIE